MVNHEYISNNTLVPSAAVLGGRIFAVGGDDGVANLNTAECYDAQLNEWGEVVRPMGTRRCFPGVVAYQGWLYVAGNTQHMFRTLILFVILTNQIYLAVQCGVPPPDNVLSLISLPLRWH